MNTDTLKQALAQLLQTAELLKNELAVSATDVQLISAIAARIENKIQKLESRIKQA